MDKYELGLTIGRIEAAVNRLQEGSTKLAEALKELIKRIDMLETIARGSIADKEAKR